MKVKSKEERIEGRTDKLGRCHDLLGIARLVSWCLNRDYLIKTCLDHISRRLGKPARCLLAEGEELKLHSPEGRYGCPEDQVPVSTESIIRQVVEKGIPVNLTGARETKEYRLIPEEEQKITAIVPLWYVDHMTQAERIVGALIIESNGAGTPISSGDFDYLKLVGELIGGAIGKVELGEQIIESYRRKEAMVKETTHLFRNRITAIGTFSRHIARSAHRTDLARKARMLYQEVLELEAHLTRFEKYMDI